MKRYLGIIVIILLVFTLLYVWPGVYRYRYDSNGPRVDRLTGAVQAWHSEAGEWGEYDPARVIEVTP